MSVPCTSTADGRAECFLPLACSAKALSKYSEMVDGIIRQQKDRREAASDEARAKLREWDMPDALHVSHAAVSTVHAHRLPGTLMCQLQGYSQAAEVLVTTCPATAFWAVHRAV